MAKTGTLITAASSTTGRRGLDRHGDFRCGLGLFKAAKSRNSVQSGSPACAKSRHSHAVLRHQAGKCGGLCFAHRSRLTIAQHIVIIVETSLFSKRGHNRDPDRSPLLGAPCATSYWIRSRPLRRGAGPYFGARGHTAGLSCSRRCRTPATSLHGQTGSERS